MVGAPHHPQSTCLWSSAIGGLHPPYGEVDITKANVAFAAISFDMEMPRRRTHSCHVQFRFDLPYDNSPTKEAELFEIDTFNSAGWGAIQRLLPA